ncbi:MAG: hypothetical protein M1820_004709 [Bogoriella megaspora]|nr:MAG: hypothetical protein M1820_004709 [Bogoriella megaspora]
MANPAPGAVAADLNGDGDPFLSTSSQGNTQSHRYSAFDSQLLSLYSTNSPSQAKRALEAHLAETDRRLKDASRLGETLVEQRKELSARLKDVDKHKDESEIGPELRQKLADLEKEYNEVGQDAARAFVPKSRISSNNSVGSTDSPSVLSSDVRNSPSKVQVPTSRKQRNQPSNRVHDIEFATEISTSLLQQVRQLQAALAERDEANKFLFSEKSRLELDAEGFEQRIRAMDESEQRYKDENWNLETQLQDLTATSRESARNEQRLTAAVNAAKNEKSSIQREFEELKATHGKLTDDHLDTKKQHDLELSSLKRDASLNESERTSLQKRVQELTSQNQELAKAVSYRFRTDESDAARETASESEDAAREQNSPEHSPPPSPSKMTPRHGGLESETLKSSLHHAQRMIQNLKGNIHREKTEKMELRRMLQDARDELEQRRGDGVAASGGKKRKGNGKDDFKKPARPDRLGGARQSTHEIFEDDDWEEHDAEDTPVRSGTIRRIGSDQAVALSMADNQSINDSTDAFETANEKENTATETEAFQTGAESLAGDSSDELTETEDMQARQGASSSVTPSSRISGKAAKRLSFQSTASTSGDEGDPYDLRTSSQQPKYKLKLGRGGYRKSTSGSRPSSTKDSPASVFSNHSGAGMGQSLAAELEDLDNSDEGSAADATPSKSSIVTMSRETSPDLKRKISPLASSVDTVGKKAAMVDSGTMTEPWEPASTQLPSTLASAGVPIAGGVGYVLGTNSDKSQEEIAQTAIPSSTTEASTTPAKPESVTPTTSDQTRSREVTPATATPIAQQRTGEEIPERPATSHRIGQSSPSFTPIPSEPVPPLPESLATPVKFASSEAPRKENLAFSSIESQDFEPVEVPQLEIPPKSISRVSIAKAPTNLDQENTAKSRAGLLGSIVPWTRSKSSLKSDSIDGEGIEPNLQVERGPSPNEPRLVFGEHENRARLPMGELSNNALNGNRSISPDPFQLIRPLRLKQTDESTQTMVSSEDIDALMKAKNKKTLNFTDPPSSPSKSLASGRGSPKRLSEPIPERLPRRPGSSGSVRKSTADQPPLPADHREVIAAAVQKTPSTSMGPPSMPASAYRANSQLRSRTPTNGPTPASPRSGTTPRPRLNTNRSDSAPSPITRRSSVSSFASELDERFNISRNGFLPSDLPPQTDPRMIQAITQTMIGEFLWKYTRRAGRGEMSENRHRRYFWVHPYTRTLYWSEQDPGTAGRAQLKAKSVAIEDVHVVTDDNPMPPGLHRKSLVIVTPGRSIKFTAPTSQRHETWFNALSYLIQRTSSNKPSSAAVSDAEDTDRERGITEDDVAEFNPGYTGARSSSRMTRGSKVSLASFGSRQSYRNASPQRPDINTPSLAQRQSAAAARAASAQGSPVKTPGRSVSHQQQQGSVSGRLSSLSGMVRGSFSSMRNRASFAGTASGYDESGSIASGSVSGRAQNDSAEDLRQVIAQQERQSDRLENVRACCDGKHDVGTLHHFSRRNGSVSSKHSKRQSTIRSTSRLSRHTEDEA